MKQCIYLIAVLASFLTACSSRTNYNKELVRADSLMDSRPDSALNILQDFPLQQLNTQADRAYYALLLTQARDKNFIIQTNDSLICIAVHYYDSIKDTKMQALANYYWGAIFRDRNEQAKAVEKYIKAASFSKETNNQFLLGRIYNNLGYLYYLQNMYEKSDSYFQQAEQIGVIIKDTSLWVEAISMQGKISLYKKDYLQAERKLLKAQEILSNFKQDGVRAGITVALSTLYSRMREEKKALQYAKQNICLQKDTVHCYQAFLILGEAYFWNNQYDSAKIYLKKSLSTTRYATKSSAYMRLAKIAEKEGDIALTLKLERLSFDYQDSLNLASQSTAIIEAEQQIKIEQKDTLYEQLSSRKNHYIVVTTIFAILFIFLIYRRYKKRLDQQKHEQHLREENLHQLQTLLKEQLEQKEKQKIVREEESSETSDVTIKMKRIIAAYKEYGKSEESIKQKDWNQLITEVNDNSNNIISRLQSQYHLSESEIHLCCLFLTDLPISYFGLLLNCTRDAVYKKADRILERKMGFAHKEASLPDVLKILVKGTI